MKKSMKKMGAMTLALVLAATTLPAHKVEAAGNTSIKGMKELKKGSEYQYDIDGDGNKDTIHWTLTEKNEEKSVLAVYVNSKKIYSLTEKGIGERHVALCNIDNKDNFVEILVEDCTDYGVNQENCTFLRYNQGVTSTLFQCDGTENQKRYGMGTYNAWSVKGNGTIIHKNSCAFSTYTTGCIQLQVPLKLKNNKLVYAAKNNYKLNNMQKAMLGTYNYKAGNKIKVYKKASKKSKVAFTMKKGQRFCAKKLYVVKWGKNEDGYYEGKKFFVQIKTKNGKTGWVYIPSLTNQSQDFTGGGTVTLPAWN